MPEVGSLQVVYRHDHATSSRGDERFDGACPEGPFAKRKRNAMELAPGVARRANARPPARCCSRHAPRSAGQRISLPKMFLPAFGLRTAATRRDPRTSVPHLPDPQKPAFAANSAVHAVPP